MKRIKVNLGERSYDIVVGLRLDAVLSSFLKRNFAGRKALVVTDKSIARFHLKNLLKILRGSGLDPAVHIVPRGERAKSERELFRVYRSLIRHGSDRTSLVVALGGGVIGDLAGFAAATYMRGIAFINCPTTLLAQVDSSIGGKTGIDLKEGKNLTGVFYQPRLVLCDQAYLKTLPQREFVGGLAEVIKYGVLDGSFFKYLEKNIGRILKRDTVCLSYVVGASARIKARIVERDECEKRGLRAILNLGHTFAHGFEGAAGYRKINHAQAVAIGLIAAARLSMAKGFFSKPDFERLVSLIKKSKLPVALRGFSLSPKRVIDFMKHDKKARLGRLTFILPARIGKVRITNQVSGSRIRQALSDVS